MSGARKVIKTVKSGVPHLVPDVDIYDSTVEHMFDAGHTDEANRLDDVYECISNPHEVYKSKTNDKSYCMFNNEITNESGTPIRVVVKRVSDSEAIMSTAHYFDGNRGDLVWSFGGEGNNNA